MINSSDKVLQAFKNHKKMICHEVLALEVIFSSNEGEEVEINGESAKISLYKI